MPVLTLTTTSGTYVIHHAGVPIAAGAAPQSFAVASYFATHGGDPVGVGDCTAAIRAALQDATDHGAFAEVVLPAGILNAAPVYGATRSVVWTFTQSHDIRIRGAGSLLTTIRLWARPDTEGGAWRDPADAIRQRGGFVRVTGAQGTVTLEDFACDGQAPPNEHAGEAWDDYDWGDDCLEGWDVSHKFISCSAAFARVELRRIRLRRFRGEEVYAGGDESNGTIVMQDCTLSECNASAISCTASMVVDGLEVFDVYNAFENFMFGAQTLMLTNSVIDPGRTFAYGKFGVVIISQTGTSALIADCDLRGGTSSAVYLSQFAHNVTLRDCTVTDASVSASYLVGGAYPTERVGHEGFTGIVFERVEWIADAADLEECCFAYGVMDWVFDTCTFTGRNGHTIDYVWTSSTGNTGEFVDCDFGTVTLRNPTTANWSVFPPITNCVAATVDNFYRYSASGTGFQSWTPNTPGKLWINTFPVGDAVRVSATAFAKMPTSGDPWVWEVYRTTTTAVPVYLPTAYDAELGQYTAWEQVGSVSSSNHLWIQYNPATRLFEEVV